MDKHFNKCVDNMYNAVCNKNLDVWLKDFEPAADRGFAFTQHKNIDIISIAVHMDGHSGCSFATCMRIVQSRLRTPKSI